MAFVHEASVFVLHVVESVDDPVGFRDVLGLYCFHLLCVESVEVCLEVVKLAVDSGDHLFVFCDLVFDFLCHGVLSFKGFYYICLFVCLFCIANISIYF